MKLRALPALTLCLLALSSPALADKAPAVLSSGSAAAACHLATHLEAYTCGWDGTSPAFSQLDGCEDYGHVHCYGSRVSLWDTPKKGDKNVRYYAYSKVGYLEKDSEFQLADVVGYKGQFYAMVRLYIDGHIDIAGWVNADYIGCDCETTDTLVEIPVYESSETFFPG